MKNGKFVVSLDFELMWGVRDQLSLQEYGTNILGVHQVIPKLLKAFEIHKIRATFSTVGFLFFENKSDLLNNLPSKLPQYSTKSLSPYLGYFDMVGTDAVTDPAHYAPGLIRQILSNTGQEIGSHTFSHYYCLEEGQNINTFEADLRSAQKAAKKFNLELTSLVFPRNQFNSEYLNICRELGIITIRGNEHFWLYNGRRGNKETTLRRGLRLMDAYVNLSGHNCYSDEFLKSTFPVDIPASRFLRPYLKKLAFLEKFRLQRIKSGMTHAAKNGLTYHLWWHPHNFGINQDQNFRFLDNVLEHYRSLHLNHQFQSYNMSELAKIIINAK